MVDEFRAGLDALRDGASFSNRERQLLLHAQAFQDSHPGVVLFQGGIDDFGQAVDDFIDAVNGLGDDDTIDRILESHSSLRGLKPQEIPLTDQSETDLLRQLSGRNYGVPDLVTAYGIKPSRNPESSEVNGRYRLPSSKRNSHKTPSKALGYGFNAVIVYGKFVSNISNGEAREYNTNERQTKKLQSLIRALSDEKSRHAKLMELYEDLSAHKSSLFPNRKLHEQLMATLQSAVNQNIALHVSLVYGPENLPMHERVPVGYTLRMI